MIESPVLFASKIEFWVKNLWQNKYFLLL
jgi:hypothetical protein